jgi:GTP cyclohydrolase I
VTKPTEEILLNETKEGVKLESVASLVRKMIPLIGEDPEREGLKKTPERYEKALKFLTSGYHQNLDHLLNGEVQRVL